MDREMLGETEWDHLAEFLVLRSEKICEDNGCTKKKHFCESNAYITENGHLVDICVSDFFQEWGFHDKDKFGQLVVIPLPWKGTGKKLKDIIDSEINLICE